MEQHVHNHLYNYLVTNGLLCDSQSGFRKNHSCNTCLTNICEIGYENINNDHIVGLVALDFCKAFDILNFDILCKKLKLYVILTNRNQCVNINNTSSEECILTSSVPKGSILGPLVFIVYVNDLSLHCKYSSVHTYADDTSLVCPGKTLDNIHLSLAHDLTAIEHRCMSNRFVINVQKSSVMIICSRQKRKFINVDNFNLKLYGSILPLVSQQKILGLTIDDNLTWKEHIVSLCNILSSLI